MLASLLIYPMLTQLNKETDEPDAIVNAQACTVERKLVGFRKAPFPSGIVGIVGGPALIRFLIKAVALASFN